MAAVIEQVVDIKFQFPVDAKIITEIIFVQIDGSWDIHLVIPEINENNQLVEGKIAGQIEGVFDGSILAE